MAKRIAKPKVSASIIAAIAAPKPISTSEYKALTKAQVISELTKSPHGDLMQFTRVGLVAAKEDPEFFGRLLAWNHVKGQVRDSKVALPIIALTGTNDPELRDNALAHLADLRPREFRRALEFARTLGRTSNELRRLVDRYLRDLEANIGDWERTVIQHQNTLKWIYSRFRVAPAPYADYNLFGPVGSKKNNYKPKQGKYLPRFAALNNLKNMSPEQVAGTIGHYKLPFMAVRTVLQNKLKDPDVLCAIIPRMSPTELVTNMKALERLGVKENPAARAALENALGKAATAKTPKATLKTTVAAEAVEDESLKIKLRTLQEKQLNAIKGIDGDWLVLGDRSGSMSAAIEAARHVAGVLARMVRGKVYLVFFDDSPLFYDVTGKTMEEINALTKRVAAGGSTSIGCGLQLIADKGLHVDGIAVVTDGGENASPYFYDAYKRYVQKQGNEPSVYAYAVGSYSQAFENYCKGTVDVTRIDISKADYYSLPNVVQTMRVGKYSLYEEIMQTAFRTVDEVLDRTVQKQLVHA